MCFERPPSTNLCALCHLGRSLSLNAQCFPLPLSCVTQVLISTVSSPPSAALLLGLSIWGAPQSSGAPPGSPNKISTPRTVNLQTFSTHFLSPALSHSICSAPREYQSSYHPTFLAGPFASLEVGLTGSPSAEHHKEKWKHSCAVREMLRAGERSWGHLTLSPPKLLKAIPVKREGSNPRELTFGSLIWREFPYFLC